MMAKGCAAGASSVLRIRGREKARERPNWATGHEREEQCIISCLFAGRKKAGQDTGTPMCSRGRLGTKSSHCLIVMVGHHC